MGAHGQVDKHEILERVADLQITTWSYLSEDRTVRHIGPMAQEFYAAFGVGESNQRIDSADGFGVALAAIQALYDLLRRQDGEIAELRASLGRLKQA
jgi:hypothetical protein